MSKYQLEESFLILLLCGVARNDEGSYEHFFTAHYTEVSTYAT